MHALINQVDASAFFEKACSASDIVVALSKLSARLSRLARLGRETTYLKV